MLEKKLIIRDNQTYVTFLFLFDKMKEVEIDFPAFLWIGIEGKINRLGGIARGNVSEKFRPIGDLSRTLKKRKKKKEHRGILRDLSQIRKMKLIIILLCFT